MYKQIAKGLHDELQGQRALSRWDNEGGAGPGVASLERGPASRQPAKLGLVGAEVNRPLKLGHLTTTGPVES